MLYVSSHVKSTKQLCPTFVLCYCCFAFFLSISKSKNGFRIITIVCTMFQLAYNVKLFMIFYLMFNWNYFQKIINQKNAISLSLCRRTFLWMYYIVKRMSTYYKLESNLSNEVVSFQYVIAGVCVNLF